ncbi:LOW QUALITY PROTEIN: micos complex subunit [Plakobranchus ocellatus]|uniref:Micos complex subunit n=1 Tax=Plakobranchus ocellatus TaxID=259542 RepID=A0AAV4BR11_9GAST|nr:LOW QUALITY PROTEIN: micos complex subunit [Plakobranchus ocellatus]
MLFSPGENTLLGTRNGCNFPPSNFPQKNNNSKPPLHLQNERSLLQTNIGRRTCGEALEGCFHVFFGCMAFRGKRMRDRNHIVTQVSL